MIEILKKAKNSQSSLKTLTPQDKEKTIKDMAKFVRIYKDEILKANKIDIENAINAGLSKAMIDRLRLDDKRMEDIIKSLNQTAILKDPTNRVLDSWVNYAGLEFKKISIPLGVVCVIYESRPNVTTEVASLCFKSSNAAVLKGGKEAYNSNLALIKAVKSALRENEIDENVVTFIESVDRKDTDKLIKMDEFIDVIVPRGGSTLIKHITLNSTIPVIKHDKGICHIFVDKSANLDNALKICINAKVQKPSACNAVETILIDKDAAGEFLPRLKMEFDKFGVEIYGSKEVRDIIECQNADESSYENEYLRLALNIKIVQNLAQAIEHIRKFSSLHSEAIISNDEKNIAEFLNSLDSACLYVNASTRFSDGYEFGFGAEVGISTNKLHARGPMGLNELTTYKYIIKGSGQIR